MIARFIVQLQISGRARLWVAVTTLLASPKALDLRLDSVVKMTFESWVIPLQASIYEHNCDTRQSWPRRYPEDAARRVASGGGRQNGLESDGENVTLRPVRSASLFSKEHCVWVFRGTRKVAAATTDKVLRDLRGQRDIDNSGARP
jgi:hypothetical protein